jgi:hypothetical protein
MYKLVKLLGLGFLEKDLFVFRLKMLFLFSEFEYELLNKFSNFFALILFKFSL